MFSEQTRAEIRERIIQKADADSRITGVALTGSGSVGAEDAWSDVDLAFGVGVEHSLEEVIGSWTTAMYQDNGAVDHLDVTRGNTIYRVFLLTSSLQVDLAFSPESEFGPVGPTWHLVSGTSAEQEWTRPADPATAIGMAWLYALHARSSIARGRDWQAEYMISGMRDEVLSLACIRVGLPAHQGRGLDDLPSDVKRAIEDTLIRQLNRPELLRAFSALTEALVAEAKHFDEARADRLAPVLREMVRSSTQTGDASNSP